MLYFECTKMVINFSDLSFFDSSEIPIVGLPKSLSNKVFLFATPHIDDVVNSSNFLIIPFTRQGTRPHNATGENFVLFC